MFFVLLACESFMLCVWSDKLPETVTFSLIELGPDAPYNLHVPRFILFECEIRTFPYVVLSSMKQCFYIQVETLVGQVWQMAARLK